MNKEQLDSSRVVEVDVNGTMYQVFIGSCVDEEDAVNQALTHLKDTMVIRFGSITVVRKVRNAFREGNMENE